MVRVLRVLPLQPSEQPGLQVLGGTPPGARLLPGGAPRRETEIASGGQGRPHGRSQVG